MASKEAAWAILVPCRGVPWVTVRPAGATIIEAQSHSLDDGTTTTRRFRMVSTSGMFLSQAAPPPEHARAVRLYVFEEEPQPVQFAIEEDANEA